jgi:hypothetical protein
MPGSKKLRSPVTSCCGHTAFRSAEHRFASLVTVILIGLFVESVIFRAIENATVRRWGMQS